MVSRFDTDELLSKTGAAVMLDHGASMAKHSIPSCFPAHGDWRTVFTIDVSIGADRGTGSAPPT